MIVAPSLHEGARRGLNYAGKMVERFYGRKKRGENNECLRLVMKSSVKHITTFSEMTEEEEGLYIIPLDMSSHSYSFTAPVCYMTFLYSPAAFKVCL
jgi:hypothetical protein